jgi:hypothetical protein
VSRQREYGFDRMAVERVLCDHVHMSTALFFLLSIVLLITGGGFVVYFWICRTVEGFEDANGFHAIATRAPLAAAPAPVVAVRRASVATLLRAASEAPVSGPRTNPAAG